MIFRPRSSFRKHTGETASRGGFSILRTAIIRKTPQNGALFLFLYLLERFVFSGGWIKLLKLNLALNLLLVLARIDYVPGRAFELYKVVL